MNTLKFILSFTLIISLMTVQAQEYKVQKSTGRLELHIGSVTVESHAGNEIIFSSKDARHEKDERAVGLVAINGSGMEDNTGLGINVSNKTDAVVVNQLNKTKSPAIKILVPKGVIVSYEYESQYGGKARFINLENELEISATYNGVVLENVTGPATVKTIYSSIDADFSANVKGPISLISIYSTVDVSLPATLKADLSMKTSYGEMFVAPEFKIELTKTMTDKDGEMVNMSSNKVLGKINGGGLKLDLRSDYSKIYLRKK
jgi:hypothetical protein